MKVKKSIEQSFEEMININNLIPYPSAFTVWNDNYYEYIDESAIQRYHRWYNPYWVVPDHVQQIINFYMDTFGCCKVSIADKQNNIDFHRHRVTTGNFSVAFTMCLPMELGKNHKFIFQYENVNIKRNRIQTIECGEYDRLFFNSTAITHGVTKSTGKWYFITFDYGYIGNNYDTHLDIRKRKIDNMEDLASNIAVIDNNPSYVKQMMPEFNKLLESSYILGIDIDKQINEWHPPIRFAKN